MTKPTREMFNLGRKNVETWLRGLSQQERDVLSGHGLTALRTAFAYAIHHAVTDTEPDARDDG